MRQGYTPLTHRFKDRTMESNTERLKALHRTFGKHKASVFACRPPESPRATSCNNSPVSANARREPAQAAFNSRSDPDTHADILGKFSDAIGLVETAYTALETYEMATFAVTCLRFGLDMLNRAYNELDRAVIPNAGTRSDIVPLTASQVGADPAPT
jgi:hypothetical protein